MSPVPSGCLPPTPNKDEYYMSKGNVIPRGVKGLKYAASNVPITLGNGKPGTSFRIDWLGEHDLNADDVAQKDKDVQKNGRGAEVTMLSQMKLLLRAELEKAPRLATEMYRMGEAKWGEDSSKTLKRAQLAIGGLTTKTKPYYWYLPGHEPVAVTPMPEVTMDDVEDI
jgi:hypothetical protein